MIMLAGGLGLTASGHSDDSEKLVKQAVERSTLNQAGTKPFHLKAVLAPSFERDRGSKRTGEVEIWWASPTQWKREVRSPEFPDRDSERWTGVAEKRRRLLSRVAPRNQRGVD
jgi:hypothetical protein